MSNVLKEEIVNSDNSETDIIIKYLFFLLNFQIPHRYNHTVYWLTILRKQPFKLLLCQLRANIIPQKEICSPHKCPYNNQTTSYQCL